MTDLATDTTDSTVLNPEAVTTTGSGGGTPNLRDQMRDTVAEAVAKASEAADKAEPTKEPVKEEKPADTPDDNKTEGKKAEEKPKETAEEPEKKAPERGADGKFAGKTEPDAAKEPAKDAKPEAEPKGGHIDAPAKFLPDAKEKWTNVPRPVQRDVANLMREHETEVTRYREAAERYEPIRQFDEIVRRNGRAGIHETLQEVAQLEDLMSKNPYAAINQILLRAGPRKPDGSPVSLFEVAQSVVQMGQQGYNQAVSRMPQQQAPQNDNGEIAQLKAQLAEMQQQQLAATIIEPFKRDHPRYAELEGDIAFFLQSGKIPASLSAQERLEAAYDMAVRINPASHDEAPESKANPATKSRADEPSAASSIKTAPGAVTPVEEPKRAGSARDEVERVIRRMTQSGR